MSVVTDFLDKRKKKRQTLIVPIALSKDEERKVNAFYENKERFINRIIDARNRNKLVYVRDDGQKEISIADQVTRNINTETMAWGGLLGEESPVTLKEFRAFSRIKGRVERLQSEYGLELPLTQTMARLLRGARDNLSPRAITRSQVEIDRVVVNDSGMPRFPNLDYNMSTDNEEARNKKADLLREIEEGLKEDEIE